jgi:hypothetical protein
MIQQIELLKIEFLKKKLYKKINENGLLNNEVIKLSHELDLLILEHYDKYGLNGLSNKDLINNLILPEYDKNS